MEGINDELDLAITGIAFSLTAPIGLYTVNHDSLDAGQDGNTFALSNDPDNQERAVRILEELVWEERRAIVSR